MERGMLDFWSVINCCVKLTLTLKNREANLLREEEIAKEDMIILAEAKSRFHGTRPVTTQPKSVEINHHIDNQ